jgi:glycosyltransferase involved in cell wall biosynthesis
VKIDHLSFSKSGGAGSVASILGETQSSMGHSVNFLTILDRNLFEQPTAHPGLTLAAALDKYIVRSGESASLFSLYRSRRSVGKKFETNKDSILHLHWMSGVLNGGAIERLLASGQRVVWTLHDMNAFTGGCHYSGDCTKFQVDCSNCPQVREAFRQKVRLELLTKSLRRTYGNLVVVCPSRWLADQALSSVIFKNQNVKIVRNPISSTYFETRSRKLSRAKFGIADDAFVPIAVAANLSDPLKNIKLVIKGLEKVAKETSRRIVLLLAGNQGESWKSNLIEIRCLGLLEAEGLLDAYTASDLLLSASKAESAGMTVVEGSATGTPALVLSNGGTDEFVQSGKSGLVADSESDFISQLSSVIRGERTLEALASNS